MAKSQSQQCYVFKPFHATSISAMLLRHAPLGMAIRLAKAWCATHVSVLSNCL